MRKITLLLLFVTVFSFGQTKFNLVSDLQNRAARHNAAAIVNGYTSLNDGNGGIYIFDSLSTATADGFKKVQVTGLSLGRWVRSINGETKSGSTTFGGLTGQTSYQVSHGLPFIPMYMFLQPRSLNAAVLCYVSAIGSSTFTITFVSIPVLGSNNLTFDWQAVK